MGDRVEFGMSMPDYLAVRALSKSSAGALLRSPSHLYCTPPTEPTDAMQFGTLVHALVLEPGTENRIAAVRPHWDARTKAGKELRDSWTAENHGKMAFTADEWQRAKDCASAVLAHPASRLLLDGGRSEVSIFWADERTGVPCKCRPDYLRDDLVISDLKTTADASPQAFAKTCARLGYHAAHAHYSEGVRVMYGEAPRSFILIAAEPEPPYGVAIYELDAEAVEAGALIMARAADAWLKAIEQGWNTGYPQTIMPLELPRWAIYQPENE